ncbi:MAG TPA: hypothetical protein VL133_03025, partial [Devosia sp.]|nr:hypothetical protein [Devosia sp.]
PGFTFVGGGYDGGTAYVIGDVVRDNGSSWIALQPTTGNAPPVFPITANDWWELVAAKGQDGTGTGDVVGPSGAVADRIATFDGTTGKLLKDGGKTIADLVPAAGSITNSILAPMATATIKGRIAAGAGAPSDLTAAQVLSLISAVRPCFRADKNGTDQTGVGNAPITFTHEVFDVGGYYDAANSRWTPPVGKVRLHTRVLIAGAVADQAAYVVSFTKNGIIVSSSVIRASGSASMSVDLSEIVETNGTDYWGVNLSSAGASVTASGPVEYTTFSGEML